MPSRQSTTPLSLSRSVNQHRASILPATIRMIPSRTPRRRISSRLTRASLPDCRAIVASILKMAGLDWPVPDFSTLSRRQGSLVVDIPHRRATGPLNLLVDSTGIKFLGDGEWLARKHGTHRRRQYRKVHLAMDTATGDIRAVEFTSSREGDSPVLPDLLDQIPADEQVGTVTGDGAFDTRRCHTAIVDRGGTAIIPIRKNGRLWKENCPAARARNDILRASKRFGRANWKHWSGYHVRSRIEAKMRCLKSFGERIASRDPDRQTAEIHIRIALMNRFNTLGTAETERVA
ncbi:IS5 family transposase (plasmid) [Haematobacter massiliensis]|nr:IS5 family transposase [Haematobacter massiliensis]QBJ23042.1 IS5 family transposase [Haematobacter massiliensis]